MRRIVPGLLVCMLAIALLPQAVSADPEHSRPQGPAKVAFAEDFPGLVDHEWGFALGGWGGERRGAPRQHVPVIFVHGNTVDAADWYPVRDAFKAAGWTDQELYALSYNGLGGSSGTAVCCPNPQRDAEHQEMGADGQSRITNNDVNVPDLHDFILAVQDYTGSERFSIVGHSLGVTLARKTLQVHTELRADLVGFVGIAGGNHGTSLCPPGSEGQVVSCDEIAAGTDWLAGLNGPDGADETYSPAEWMTVSDGSGAGDPAFAGPTYAQSPRLRGAENRQFSGTYHNDLRLRPDIVTEYRLFLEEAEAASAQQSADDDPPVDEVVDRLLALPYTAAYQPQGIDSAFEADDYPAAFPLTDTTTGSCCFGPVPDQAPLADLAPPFAEFPSSFELIELTSYDGTPLHAFASIVPGAPGIVVAHGFNTNGKHSIVRFAAFLRANGFSVIAPDHRDVGREYDRGGSYHPDGTRHGQTLGWKESEDFLVAAEELARRGVTEIGMLGFSEGAQNTVLTLSKDYDDLIDAALTFSAPADQATQVQREDAATRALLTTVANNPDPCGYLAQVGQREEFTATPNYMLRQDSAVDALDGVIGDGVDTPSAHFYAMDDTLVKPYHATILASRTLDMPSQHTVLIEAGNHAYFYDRWWVQAASLEWFRSYLDPDGDDTTAEPTIAQFPGGTPLAEQTVDLSGTTREDGDAELRPRDACPPSEEPVGPTALLDVEAEGPRAVADGRRAYSGWDEHRLAGWSIDFGDGTAVSGDDIADAQVERTYTESGTYEIVLTVTDDTGRTATATREVTVTAPITQPPPGEDGQPPGEGEQPVPGEGEQPPGEQPPGESPRPSAVRDALAEPGDDVVRVAGDGRVQTAGALALEAFPDGASQAVLARADAFPDALAAATLAAEIDGPVLLTGSDRLDDDTAEQLADLGVDAVYLAGGEAALSAQVADDVASLGIDAMRLGGATRFHTAASIAREVVALGGQVDQVVVARADAFPDALAAGNLATAARAPILLTGSEDLPDVTLAALGEVLAGDDVAVAGGTAAVGTGPESELRAAGYTVARLAGTNRYETAVALVDAAVAAGAAREPTLLASGVNFPDALAAVPASHELGGTLLLVAPDDLTQSPATADYLRTHAAVIDTAVVTGGPSAIAPAVEAQVADLIAD